VGADPDALWKPGFAGEVVYPARAAPAPRASRPRRENHLVLGAAVVVAVLAGIVAALAVTRGEPGAPAAAAPRVPTHVMTRWTATVPGQVWSVTMSDDVVLAAAHGSRAGITALRADNGAVLWSRDGDRATLAAVGIMGETAFYLTSPTRGDDDLVGVDLHTGAERWRRPMPTKSSLVQVAGHHVLVTRVALDRPWRTVGVDLLDADDGTIRASVDGARITIRAHDIEVRDGATFDLYDIETLARTAHVTIAELGDEPASVVRVGDAMVALTTMQALMVDDSGAVRQRVPLRAGDPVFTPYGLVFDDHVAMLTSSGLVVLRVVDGTIREVWRRDAYAMDQVVDGARPLAALSLADPRSLSGTDIPTAVVDLASGATVWTGHLDRPRGGARILTATGFVVDHSAPDPGGPRRTVVGIDPNGRTMWSETVSSTTYTVVGSGALVAVEPTEGHPDDSTVTLLG
jgi:hypothetical protein